MKATTFTRSKNKTGPAPPRSAGSTYAQLAQRIRTAGLMNRRPGYYTAKITLTVAALLAGWAVFVLLGDSWWQLVVAAYLGLAFTQVAFVGHDAGHRQIFRTRRAAYVTGLLLGNIGVGLSYGWWVDKHNRHHAHPNDTEKDPDVEVGALVYTSRQAGLRRGVARWLTRCQAYLFFPMLLLEGMNLHVASARALTGHTVRSRGARLLEAVLFLAHVAGYLTVVFLVLSPLQAVAFVLVHQAVFGLYMGMSFAPNHKGMPEPSDEDRRDYLRRQVLTSRNIRGGPVVDLALGGLNYQIEHHLFPSMPRPNLRRAQHVVHEFCAEQGVSYTETGILRSYGMVLRHLYDVGGPLRAGAQ